MIKTVSVHELTTKQTIQTKPNHLGDILSARETIVSFPLEEQFNGIERVLLTANGNLQRIMSAYYNSQVTVNIIHSTRISNAFDREVILSCNNKVLYFIFFQ